MSKTAMISLLQTSENGEQLLAVLDSFGDTQPAYDYIESPMLEAALIGQPTFETIDF